MYATDVPCVLGDSTHGVPRHHSDDRVTIFHGSTDPIVACGFHASYHLDECYRAARAGRSEQLTLF